MLSASLWATTQQESLKVRLFISASLGESLINSLIQEMAHHQEVTLVIRGMAPQDQNLWNTPIIALDMNDKQQQKAVIPWLKQYPDALVMVTGWSLAQLKTLPVFWHEHPIYLLPPELTHRFQLSAVPVLITPENQNQ